MLSLRVINIKNIQKMNYYELKHSQDTDNSCFCCCKQFEAIYISSNLKSHLKHK